MEGAITTENEPTTIEEQALIETDLSVSVFHNNVAVENFTDSRKVEMHPNFLNSKEGKKHTITSHSRRFKNKIALNHRKEELQSMNKWRICMVDF